MRIWNVAGPKGLLLGLAFLWSTPAIRANIDASSGIAGTIGYLGWQAML